jgi:hypothetical protein
MAEVGVSSAAGNWVRPPAVAHAGIAAKASFVAFRKAFVPKSLFAVSGISEGVLSLENLFMILTS